MAIHDIVRSLLKIETRLQVFERRYGIKSADFYRLAEGGRLNDLDGRDEFFEFLEWRGLYKLWLDCKEEYDQQIRAETDLLSVIAHYVPVAA